MGKPAETWMPLYIGDYLADTMHLTHAQHGIYLLLIMAYWRSATPLPDDPEQLAAIAKCSAAEWRKHHSTIRKFFTVNDGVWSHKRIDTELAAAARKTQERRKSGANGAAKRWQSDGKMDSSAIDLPIANEWQNDAQRASPSPSPSSSLRSEDSVSLRSTGVARAPPLPHDGVKNLWDKGLSILGPKQRSLLGKLRKSHGDPAVLAAIVDCEAENPSDPPAFLIACCERRRDNDRRLSPVENLYLGAARAADAFDRRQRQTAGCPDCKPAQPLLDRC